jgi:stage II sporulation protein R
MKKKTIVWAYLIVLSLGTILSLYIPKNEVAAKDAIVIPGQAIRLRILANSDLEGDQALKRKVRDAVNAKISVWVQDLTSINEARKVIKAKLPDIQATAEAVVKQEGSKQAVKVEFSKKVQFPTKLYGQFLYPAGDYEAILITLGEGKGANWWCVLFPPLCFLDFSNGVAVSKGFEEQQTSTAEKAAPVKAAKAEDGPAVESNSQTAESAAANSAANGEKDKSEANAESAAVPNAKAEDASVKGKKRKGIASEITKSQQTAAPNQVQKQLPSEEIAQSAALDTTKDPSVSTHNGGKAPVYTSGDEEPVKVKFFIVELWNKIF